MRRDLILLNVAVTHRCNFRCRHCLIPEFEAELPYETIMRLWDEAQKLNCLTVELVGGEPFLRNDLVKIAEGAREKGYMLKITSNGSCIKHGVARELSEIGVLNYQVSIYGAFPETYQTVTGEGEGFYEAQKGVKILLENGARVILKMTVVKENFGDVEKVNEYFLKMQNDYGKDRVRIGFSSLIYPTYNHNMKSLQHMVTIDQQVELARKGYVSQLTHPHTHDPQSPLCHAGISMLYISANGNVYPCSFFCAPVGNIFEDSLMKIWIESDFLDKLRRRRAPECASCEYFTECIRCPAMAYYFHKDINRAPEIICKIVKAISTESS